MRVPVWMPRWLRSALGSVTCPLEVTVASTVVAGMMNGFDGMDRPPYILHHSALLITLLTRPLVCDQIGNLIDSAFQLGDHAAVHPCLKYIEQSTKVPELLCGAALEPVPDHRANLLEVVEDGPRVI